MNKRIKVFNVDDSPIYRQVLKDIISSDPNLEYMGFAANGAIAVKKLELIDRCGDVEFRLVEGSDDFVQLESFLAFMGK